MAALPRRAKYFGNVINHIRLEECLIGYKRHTQGTAMWPEFCIYFVVAAGSGKLNPAADVWIAS
jgi:hypothetical protein